MIMTELTQSDVLAENAMISPPPTQPIATNEAAINPKLQRRLAFLDLEAVAIGPVHQNDEVAPFIKEAEKIRKAKAEKRLDTKLRKLEVEQKAILLAEAKESLEEARRKFESQPQLPYDYSPRSSSSINHIFREEKVTEELKALEREQKDELLRQVMEKRAREFGDDWPRIQEMSQHPRFDHIPKPCPGYKGLIPNYFHDHPLIPPQKSNEPPAAS